MRVLLLGVCLLAACANQKSTERDDDDRLSANDRSMPSAADEASSREDPSASPRDDAPPAAAREKPPEPPPRKVSGNLSDAKSKDMMADMQRQAQVLRDAQQRGEAECAPLEKLAVPWVEEDVMGGQLAIADAMMGRGLYLDTNETDPITVQKKLEKGGGAPLGPGDKNAVTEYVQRVGHHLAAASARPGIPWTFGVIDFPEPYASSQMGGWVFVTTGLLAKLSNEAELAAALAHEISHVAAKDPVNTYVKARVASCKIALMGVNITEAGATTTPGAEEFVKNAKFGKTMRKFATPGFDLLKDPEVDNDFIRWFLNRQIDFQRLMGPPAEVEIAADRAATELLAASGYDTAGLAKVIPLVTKFTDRGGSAPLRLQALEQLSKTDVFGAAGGGKAPPFPKNLKWPKE